MMHAYLSALGWSVLALGVVAAWLSIGSCLVLSERERRPADPLSWRWILALVVGAPAFLIVAQCGDRDLTVRERVEDWTDGITVAEASVLVVGLTAEAVSLFWPWLLLALACGAGGFFAGRACR